MRSVLSMTTDQREVGRGDALKVSPAQGLVDDGANVGDVFIGYRAIRRLGDDAHDRLGITGARVHPGVRPIDSDAVLGVDLFLLEMLLERFDGALRIFPAAFKFRLDDL